jgi:hypothetical protein
VVSLAGDVKSPRGQRQSVIALEEKSLVSRTPWKTANRGGSLELSEAKALYDDAAQETRPPSPRVKPPLKIDDVIQGITTSSPSVKNPLEVDDAVQAISPPSPSVQIPLAVGKMNFYMCDETKNVHTTAEQVSLFLPARTHYLCLFLFSFLLCLRPVGKPKRVFFRKSWIVEPRI